jgi:predicted PurR-regulated permease PerM
VILLSYFFVVFGVELQRQAIALLPHRYQKRLTAEILGHHRRRAVALRAHHHHHQHRARLPGGCGLVRSGLPLGDSLLWGALGGLLNFAPYVGR